MNMRNDRLRLDPAEEWYPRSRMPCTCVNRGPSMEHFEDCPRWVARHDAETMRARDEAQPGLATTEELLRELESRGRDSGSKAGELLVRDCDQILRELPPGMRSYRSIG